MGTRKALDQIFSAAGVHSLYLAEHEPASDLDAIKWLPPLTDDEAALRSVAALRRAMTPLPHLLVDALEAVKTKTVRLWNLNFAVSQNLCVKIIHNIYSLFCFTFFSYYIRFVANKLSVITVWLYRSDERNIKLS